MSDMNVSLKIRASAEGADKVRGIADDIEALGGSAQDVRDKARALGDQLATIGDKQGQINAFRVLTADLKNAQAAMEAAKAKASALQAQYESTERPTRKLATALQKASAESARLTAAYQTQVAQLNQYKSRMEAAGISATRLSEAEGRLRQAASSAAMQLHALADEAGARLASAQLKAADAADRQAMAVRRIKADSAAAELKRLRDAQDSSAAGSERLAASIAHAGHSMAGFVAAAAGVSGLADMARNTVELADRYATLSARVKLSTESEQEHAAAMAGLFEIAQRNSASLEATSELYGKVAVSVREMGGSQADALALTEAVSQSMRLSGASASAAEGAILQLGQALASGALRGDEFNSIAEASPRLMQALADGLGVPRGELRAMAEQGKLTADVVIQALLSQKDALEAEYTQLPDTVGAALQRLRNEWMRMVGEFDQGNGVTASLASGIGMLTKHLDDLASMAGAVGGAVAAGLAAKGGAAMLKFAGDLAAATEKAGGLRAAINSLPTSVKIGIAFAGAEIVLANIDTIVEAMARHSQAAQDAEAMQDRVNQQLLEGQRASIAQAEAYRQYADTAVLSAQQVAALSEAERARYQQGIEGATSYEKAHISALLRAQALGLQVDADLSAARHRMAELRQGAEDLRIGLEIAARRGAELYAQAARLVDAAKFAQGLAHAIKDAAEQGKSAAGQIDAIVGAIDLINPANVGAMAQAMSMLREQSAQAADLLEQRLADAIQKMSAADLAQFAQNIRAAFEHGRMAAEDFAKVTDQILSASFQKLGLSAETALGRITPAVNEGIAALQGLATAIAGASDSPEAKMRAMELATGELIKKFQNTTDIAAFSAELERMEKAQTLSSEAAGRLRDALAEQRVKIEQAIPGIQSMEEAYAAFGLRSQQALQSVVASLQQAYDTLAAGGAPVAALDAAWGKLAEAKLQAAQAAGQYQLANQIAMLEAQATTEGQRQKLEDLKRKYQEIAETQIKPPAPDFTDFNAGLDASGNRVDQWAQRIANATSQWELDDIRDDIESAFKSGEISAGNYLKTLDQIDAKQEQIASQVKTITVQWDKTATSMADAKAMQDAMFQATIQYQRQFMGSGPGHTLEYYYDQVYQKIYQQKQALDEVTRSLEEGRNIARFAAMTQADAAGYVKENFSMLNESLKNGFLASLERARSELAALRDDSARTLASVQDEFDQMVGNLDEIEKRRADQKLAELQAKLAEARAAGDQQAIRDLEKALSIQRQINDERIKEAKMREAELNAGSAKASSAQPATQTAKTVNVRLTLPNGQTKTVQTLAGSEDALLDALETLGARA